MDNQGFTISKRYVYCYCLKGANIANAVCAQIRLCCVGCVENYHEIIRKIYMSRSLASSSQLRLLGSSNQMLR